MVSKLVLLANVFGLFLIDAFLLADVRISQNLPESMAPGTEVRVTVTVDKGDLTGFAKLQFDLPAGMSATAIEAKGASFTFAEGKAKFIWMALPASPSFKISYTLTADADATGPKQIQGRLSYIEDNERKTYELPVATVQETGSGSRLTIEFLRRKGFDGGEKMVSPQASAIIAIGDKDADALVRSDLPGVVIDFR